MLFAAYKAEVIYRGRKFVDDQATRDNILSLAKVLTDKNNTTFGFMLNGNCGNGKTTLLHAFQSLLNLLVADEVIDPDMGIRIVDAKDVTRIYKKSNEWSSLRNATMLAIEDLGKESTDVVEFGNVYSPFIDLLEYRYDRQLFTAFTTNLSPSELKEKYDERIADRFREMLARVSFKQPSYRKQNKAAQDAK